MERPIFSSKTTYVLFSILKNTLISLSCIIIDYVNKRLTFVKRPIGSKEILLAQDHISNHACSSVDK